MTPEDLFNFNENQEDQDLESLAQSDTLGDNPITDDTQVYTPESDPDHWANLVDSLPDDEEKGGGEVDLESEQAYIDFLNKDKEEKVEEEVEEEVEEKSPSITNLMGESRPDYTPNEEKGEYWDDQEEKTILNAQGQVIYKDGILLNEPQNKKVDIPAVFVKPNINAISFEEFWGDNFKDVKSKLQEKHGDKFEFERKGLSRKIKATNKETGEETIIDLDKKVDYDGKTNISKDDAFSGYEKYINLIAPNDKEGYHLTQQLNETIQRYRNEDESNNDFLKRITPQKSQYNTIKKDAVGNTLPSVVIGLNTIDGITQIGNEFYRGIPPSNLTDPKFNKWKKNNKASEAEIEKFKKFYTLDNVYKRAQKIQQSANVEVKDDPGQALEVTQKAIDAEKVQVPENKFYDNIPEQTYDDFYYKDYIQYTSDRILEEFTDYFANQWNKVEPKLQKEFDDYIKPIQKKLFDNIFKEKYESELKEIEKDLEIKYRGLMRRAENQQEIKDLQAQHQAELNKHVDEISDKVNAEVKSEINRIRTPGMSETDPYYEVNQKLIEMDQRHKMTYILERKRLYKEYAESFRITPKYWTQQQLDDVKEILDAEHFDYQNTVGKKFLLDQVLHQMNIDGKLPNGVDIMDLRNEFYSYFYDDIVSSQEAANKNPVTMGSVFAIKEKIREEILLPIQKKIENKKNLITVNGEIDVESFNKIREMLDKPLLVVDASTLTPEDAIEYLYPDLFSEYKEAKHKFDTLEGVDLANKTKAQQFWQGVKSMEGHEYVPIYGGFVNLKRIVDKYKAAKKYQRGEDLSDKENRSLLMYSIDQEVEGIIKGMSSSYNAGRITAHSLPFMGEIILTSPLYRGVRSSVNKGIKTSIYAGMSKGLRTMRGFQKGGGSLRFSKTGKMLFVPKNFKFKVTNAIAEPLAFIAATGAQTAVNPQRYVTGTFENMMPEVAYAYTEDANGLIQTLEANVSEKDGDDFTKAFFKAFGVTWAEYATERMGEMLPGLGRAVSKPVLKKAGITRSPEWLKRIALGYWLRKTGLNRTEAALRFTRQQAGWHGVLAEVSEELINMPLSALITGEDPLAGFKDKKALNEMITSIGVTSLAFGGGGVLWSKATGAKQSKYYLDHHRHRDKAGMIRDFKRKLKNGEINDLTDIEVTNDYETYDELQQLIENHNKKAKAEGDLASVINPDVIKTQGRGISNDILAAKETEILSEMNNKEDVGELFSINDKMNDLEDQRQNTMKSYKPTAGTQSRRDKNKINKELHEIKKQMDLLLQRKNEIIKPHQEKVEKRKKTKFYQDQKRKVKRANSMLGLLGLPKVKMVEIRSNHTNMRKRDASQAWKDSQLDNLDIEQALNKRGEKVKGRSSDGYKYIAKKDVKNDKGEVIYKKGQELVFDKNTKLSGRTLEQLNKEAEESGESHGFATTNEKTGETTMWLNKDVAINTRGVNVASHEFLHHILRSIFRNNPELAFTIGMSLNKYLQDLDPRLVRNKAFRDRLRSYKKLVDKDGNVIQEGVSADQYAEEVMAVFSDALTLGEMQYNESIFDKIGTIFRRIFQNYGFANIEFGEGKDVFNFIKDYNNSINRGEISKGIAKLIKKGAEQNKDFYTQRQTVLDSFKKEFNNIDALDVQEDKKQELRDNLDRKLTLELKKIEDKLLAEAPVSGNIREIIKTIQKQKQQTLEELKKEKEKLNVRHSKEAVDVPETFNDKFTTKEGAFINKFAFNEDGSWMTKKQWDNEGFVNAYNELRKPMKGDNKGIFSDIIVAGIDIDQTNPNVHGVPLSNFVEDVKFGDGKFKGMLGILQRFNPEDPAQIATKDLSAWINRQLNFRKGDVSLEYKKRLEAGRSIDKKIKTETDETFAGQIAAPEDTETKAFEERDITKEMRPKDTTIEDITMGAALLGIKPNDPIIRKIHNIIKKSNININELDNPYKDIKRLITSREKIKNKKGKMVYPTKASDVKPTGPLYQILNIIAKEFGVSPKKILANQSFDKLERESAQKKINEIGVKKAKEVLPEGETVSGKSTDLPGSLLDAVNPKTGQKNLIYQTGERVLASQGKGTQGKKAQTKQKVEDINDQDFLGVFGVKPDGKHEVTNTKVDGALRGFIVEIAGLVANQNIRIQEINNNKPIEEKVKELDKIINNATGKYTKSRKNAASRLKSNLVQKITPMSVINLVGDGKSATFFSKTGIDKNIKDQLGKIGAIDKTLTTNEKDLFWAEDRVDTFANIAILQGSLVDETLPDKESIKLALQAAYGDVPEIMAKINKLADSVYEGVKLVLPKIKVKNQTKRSLQLVQKLLELNASSDVKVAAFTNSNIAVKTAFLTRSDKVKNQKAVNKLYLNKIFNPNDIQGFFETVMMMAQHSATGSADPNSSAYYLARSQAYTGIKEFLEETAGSIPGLNFKIVNKPRTVEGKKIDVWSLDINSITYDANSNVMRGKTEKGGRSNKIKGEKISITSLRFASNTNSAGLGSAKNKKSLKNRRLDERKTRKMLNDYVKFWSGLYKEGKIDNVDLAMIMGSLLSNMRTALARAASLKYISDNAYELNVDDLRYEHMLPRVNVIIKMFDQHINRDGIKNIDSYLKNYTVQIIPKTMDDVITDAKLGSSLYIGQTFDMPSWIRNYNDKTMEQDKNGALRPLIDIDTGDVLIPSETHKKGQDILAGQLDYIENHKRTMNVIRNSKSGVDGSKGVSVWDFDHTLAVTKSGVLARVPNPSRIPKPGRKVIFLAGGAGSGKSNIVKQLGLKNKGFKIVNSDISLEWLKKNSGLPANMNDLTPEQLSKLGKLQYESRMIAKRKQMKYQGNGDGVVIDGTGASANVMKEQVQEFKDKGYDVQMVFVETSEDVAVKRNKARKERSLTEEIVRKNHKKVIANKPIYKKLFGDNFSEVNTDNLEINMPLPLNFVEQVENFTNGYEKRRLDAEEFAVEGKDILDNGGEFDFSEFNIVKEGEKGPLFGKAMSRAKKFGTKDQFILTARPPESIEHIYEFLKSQGLNIPLENIAALGNSTGEAKAIWIVDNIVAKGYNDIYFADDAIQNVQAVDNILEQFDVKRNVQQAKIRFSKQGKEIADEILLEGQKDLDSDFNLIIEETTGVVKSKEFSAAKARIRGQKKNKFTFFIPPSAEDFEGLMYNLLGKGKVGEKHHKFFKEKLFDPFAKGIRALNLARQSVANDMKELKKNMPDVKKKLKKTIPDTEYTYEQAIRIYLFDKANYSIPGLSKTDKNKLISVIKKDQGLKTFADTAFNVADKGTGYPEPSEHWLSGNTSSDIAESLQNARQYFLQEWKDNVDVVFSEKNLNKIEAIFGRGYRDALEDILWRMENGTNRVKSQYKMVNNFMDWVNGSIGATMFVNIRSAALQTLSTVNFINWHDNNPVKAAAALANLPQFTKDFIMIFNSDFLKQRRSGLQHDVNAKEMMEAIRKSKNQYRAAINYLLQKGFKPTQIMDSFAIAFGGATFYRNRVDTYKKQGLKQKEAEDAAFTDMMEIAEATQQSAREDRISMQQASPLGKLILAFQNTPMQYMRLTKKAARDLINGRGDAKTHISKIIYYTFVQNVIFYSLQTALFAIAFGDDDEDEEKNKKIKEKKIERIINGMLDTILRGSGIAGAIVSTIKNVILKFMEQEKLADDGKFWTEPDHAYTLIEGFNLSPPIGIKARKWYDATQTWEFDRELIDHMSKTDIDNPMYESMFKMIEATTNIPTSRAYNKMKNIREALNSDNEAWQRAALFMGWSRWNLGMGETDKILDIENEIATIKQIEKKRKAEEKKKIKEAETKRQELEQEKQYEEEQEKEKKEGKKDVKCIAVNKSGQRCGMKALSGQKYCTIHQKVEKREDNKKVQCKKIKSDGKRCKMQTNNKSGLCYYHD